MLTKNPNLLLYNLYGLYLGIRLKARAKAMGMLLLAPGLNLYSTIVPGSGRFRLSDFAGLVIS